MDTKLKRMRVKVEAQDLNLIFENIRRKGISLGLVALVCGVTPRTIRDWRRGKYTMPYVTFIKLTELAGVSHIDTSYSSCPDGWHRSDAGKRGAKERANKYGPLGTPEGRRLGGLTSWQRRKNNKLDIFTPVSIMRPRRTVRLAEFVGIMIGDGGMTKHQVSVTLSSLVDYDYSLFITKLFETLFSIKPAVIKRTDSNCLVIVASSVNLVAYLKRKGVLQGDKLRQNLDIPAWILDRPAYGIACLRGIFDTDGGIYQECHRINGRLYCYPRMAFSSMSPALRLSIEKILSDLGFQPRIRNNKSVNLETRSDIVRYYKIVGTSNPKHLMRYKSFGGVG